MCGIGGIAGAVGGDAAQAGLERMVEAMRHRGPDDRGIELAAAGPGTVGLCATRLAIQDCSPKGHQPMVSAASGRCLAFNGELYNVGDLRRELIGLGHTFRGGSDTEVVLAAWDEWGLDCLSRLRGMFGLAVWDAPAGRLRIARDRLGIKPVYFAERDSVLVFGSEIRALLATGLVERRLSEAGVDSYLASGAVEEPLTIIDGVLALPPGHHASWDGERLDIAEYWSLAESFASANEAGSSRAELVAEVRAALEDAVLRHLVSDVPLGVFLSGGIDSSAMASLANHVAGEPPRTVSVVFPDREFSEERYIRMMADRLGARHTEVRLHDRDFLERLDGALRQMDQPTVDGVNTYVVSGAAREAGLTVALSGLGGDELFAGYNSFRDVPRMEALRARMPRAVGRPAGWVARSVLRSSDRGEKLGRWLGDPASAASGYALHRELFGPDVRDRLLSAGQAGPASAAAAPDGLDPVNAVSYLELTHYMRNVLLRDADVMSMAHSLEVRVPFLDHELVELAARIPGDQKLGERPKALLVEALGELLPDEVVDRRKMGFTFPFQTWMRNGLRTEVEGKLRDTSYGGAASSALEPEAVVAVWERFLDGRAAWARPWSLFVLKSWADRHLAS